jgi:FtsP/CotA-like multicopper oxidase with cupredoxin domain
MATKLTRREFTRMSGMASAVALGGWRGLQGQMAAPAGSAPAIPVGAAAADFTLEIAPYVVEASPKHKFPTLAYNGQVPGPLLRMTQGKPVTIDIHNRSSEADIVHWHGLFLPVAADGAMEEGCRLSLVPYAYICGRRFAQGAVWR